MKTIIEKVGKEHIENFFKQNYTTMLNDLKQLREIAENSSSAFKRSLVSVFSQNTFMLYPQKNQDFDEFLKSMNFEFLSLLVKEIEPNVKEVTANSILTFGRQKANLVGEITLDQVFLWLEKAQNIENLCVKGNEIRMSFPIGSVFNEDEILVKDIDQFSSENLANFATAINELNLFCLGFSGKDEPRQQVSGLVAQVISQAVSNKSSLTITLNSMVTVAVNSNSLKITVNTSTKAFGSQIVELMT